ncbi:hypothetical protein EDB81DRAFT_894248 [Dactylonectria macrodidyma]|uniref:Glycosyltransferase 2-like domain-containing protein n=1 Tax=Dactylonectria macrodidyma TaxID=307937 RepID=A0A9P9D328_9HYPO|nr:hypothetical protein EDB81DRAFT_894248 [Dactylonectria macrodidyma]
MPKEDMLIPDISLIPPARINSSVPPAEPQDPFATPPESPAITPVSPLPQAISFDRASRKVGIYGPSPLPSPTASCISLDGTLNGILINQSRETLSVAPGEKSAKPRRFCWSAFWHAINSQVSPKAIWDLINPVEYLWPITVKKYFVLFLVATAIVTIIVSNMYTHWITKSMALTHSYMLPVLIIVVGIEPAMLLIILFVAKTPSYQDSENEVKEKRIADVEAQVRVSSTNAYETAFVIPCHNSDHEALKKVFESAYPYFRPQDIFIVDNGRTRHPKDLSFRDWVKSQHSGINYMWSPIGSKNAAQMVGAMAAKNYRYILTTDDDVSLPPNYRHPIHLMNKLVKAVAFPLKGTDADGNVPHFVVSWQDCEYRLAGLTKLAESQLCGVCFPHGAGWFVERDTLVELLASYHPIDFIAEDVNSGFSLMRMKKRIAFDARVVLATEVPTTLLGPGLNWFKQRVKSWEMGRHGLAVKFIQRFFALNGQTTIYGILAQKFIMFYSLASIVIDWIRIPCLVALGGHAGYWPFFGGLSAATLLPPLLYNYYTCWRRTDMRVRFGAAITYPIYKQLYALVSIIGGIRCVLYYVGGHVKAKPIYKMVQDGDEACFWLDPKFETNPGWLADEKEQIILNGEGSTTDF